VFLVRQFDGYTQMALYSAASNFRIIVLFLPNIVNNVGMSLLNYQKGLKDEGRYRQVFWANMALTVSSVVMGALAVVLFGPLLLGAFGKSFSQGFPVVVLVLSTLPERYGT
jgi:O-antigen/teichoic acid export membrane protein